MSAFKILKKNTCAAGLSLSPKESGKLPRGRSTEFMSFYLVTISLKLTGEFSFCPLTK